MKDEYSYNWKVPTACVLGIAAVVVAALLPWPKLPQARAAGPAAVPIGTNGGTLKTIGADNSDFGQMKQVADAAISIARDLNREAYNQWQKRAALEAAVERLGYWPSYSSSNGAVRCELTQMTTTNTTLRTKRQ